jgi:hypothetical protein
MGFLKLDCNKIQLHHSTYTYCTYIVFKTFVQQIKRRKIQKTFQSPCMAIWLEMPIMS